MKTITIVGAGMMGSAMATPAFDRGHRVRLVGTPLDNKIIEEAQKTGYHPTLKQNLPVGTEVFFCDELEKAMAGADVIIGGVSSFGASWFLEKVLPLVKPEQKVLSVTKGLMAEEGRLLTIPDWMSKRYPALSLNAIGGPCISFELAKRRQTTVSFCGRNLTDAAELKALLETDYYHITATADVPGVESMVAMKNAYALGVALAVGMAELEGDEAQYNPQAALFGQAVREMNRILNLMGGESNQLSLGAGDLYVTVFGGRTRRIGTLLGRNVKYTEAAQILAGVTLESVAITHCVMDYFRQAGVNLADFPLLSHIEELLNDQQNPIPWEQFR